MNILTLFTLVSATAFIFYGALCLFTEHMKLEFERYGLSRFRKLVGVLELSGGLGLILGNYFSVFHFISAGGLSLLMILGLGARLKVRDRLVSLIPAFLLLLVNLWIFFEKLKTDV
jgi:hypothetical protein